MLWEYCVGRNYQRHFGVGSAVARSVACFVFPHTSGLHFRCQYCCVVAFLEVLVGSWTSSLLYRRRLMCLSDVVYATCKGLGQNDIVRLSQAAITDSLSMVSVAPRIMTNLRASRVSTLYWVDAFSWGTAVCKGEQSSHMVLEMTRHRIMKED